jgi:hypothetical protein
MERSSKNARREGKITLVTLFAILGLIVMAGFIGNIGQTVSTKVAAQNTSDAVAFSSAQWMARGMNAITATNHLLGEVTALSVVVEGLGGPEMDAGMKYYSPQNQTLDMVIGTLKDMAPAPAATPYATSILNSVEKPLFKFLADQMAPQSDEAKKSKAFATIYDSKLQLKMDFNKFLLVNTVANLGFFVPPPWGYISAAIAYAAHIYADLQIVEIGKEWFILQGIELVIRNPITSQLKSKFETLLIPALAAHGDFIAGRLGKKSANNPQAQSGIVNVAVGDALLHLNKVYDTKAFIYPAAPSFRMPIEAEPRPSLREGTPAGREEPEWGKDEVVTLPDSDDILSDIQENINDSKSDIKARIRNLREGLQLLDRLEADVNKLSAEEGVTPEERKKFDDEKREIARARRDKQARLAKLEKELQELNIKEAQTYKAIAAMKNMPPGTGNLSAKRAHLALDQGLMKQSEERYTQWVRATYPYVDSFRAPILKMFGEHLKRSEAARHYEKWTNRFALTKAWQFRSGYRFKKLGDTDGQWEKKPGVDPLEMYVMVGSFAKTGVRRDQKGFETWTLASDTGKQQAEQLFTVIGLAHRDVKPLFSPVIYPAGTRHGATTFAQAVFYNGNEQKPVPPFTKSTTQAKLGWDTLNWDPATNAPEWGTKLATSSAKWPWEVFTSSTALSGSAKVRLNWQAKLMPVTKTRLKGAITMPMSVDMNANVAAAYALFDNMLTH